MFTVNMTNLINPYTKEKIVIENKTHTEQLLKEPSDYEPTHQHSLVLKQ